MTATGPYAIRRHKAALDAWCWRVAFRRRDKRYAKVAYDLKHGDLAQALDAAISWCSSALA